MKMIWKLFFTFFQIGLFSIGEGYAIIPLIQAQVVTNTSGSSNKHLQTLLPFPTGIILSSLLYRFFQKSQHSSYIFRVLIELKSASFGLIVSAATTILLLTFYHTSTLSELLNKNGTSIIQWISTVNTKAVLLFFSPYLPSGNDVLIPYFS